MKRILAIATLMLAAGAAHAQGVGINTTGAAADTSAVLDLSSTTKGFLPPRMTSAQRAAVVLPATGLVVYQTDGTAGLYVNVGTPAAPNWTAVSTGGGGAGQWATSGSNIYYNSGKVAVGTAPTQFRFTAQDTGTVFRVQSNNSSGLMASFGGFGQVQVDAPGVAGGRLALLGNGNLGLGVANPTNKLSFAPVLGKKISLYPGATGDVGFGVAGNRLQIYSDNPNADVAIGYDAAGTFNERFAVKPNGALAVNGNAGAAGQVLRSNGTGAAATWTNPQSADYENLFEMASANWMELPVGNFALVPDLSQVVTVGGNAKAIVHYYLLITNASCDTCGETELNTQVTIDGTQVRRFVSNIGNGEFTSVSGTCLVQMGPGTHTIAVNARAGQELLIVGGNNASLGNTLTIQVVPQ